MKQKLPSGPMIVDGVNTHRNIEAAERKAEADNNRIGAYFSKLNTHQKKRFQSVVKSITHKFSVTARQNPLEIILIRQIALNTIRIEQAELDILNGGEDKYLSAIEKWLFSAQKERREAISTFFNIQKRDDIQEKSGGFGDLRNILRDDEDLPPSEEISEKPTSTQRRHYDKVHRTKE